MNSSSETAVVRDAGVRQTPDIGVQLSSLTHELVALGEQLKNMLDSALASRIGAALDAVTKQHSRIAIIGQIKAGKSSFVNALVKRPGLVPTDVNPWTAVVTKLHFGLPGDPEAGARFTFFDEDEWHAFAKNGGGMRALTERLVPGHEEDQHHHNLEAMRSRAEARLGRFYHRLFGNTRWYSDATPEIIERYVCLGQPIEEQGAALASGRYADITKTADIFFPRAPFGSPAVVIDTPGTNDPLLIRDEITMRSIEDADVYIVVLTAQQPLTTADLALLRILHGLRKCRILVFVNRIDDIAAGPSGAEAILAKVRGVVEREFPNARIPVVTGSAFWANCALNPASGDLEHIWDDEFLAFALAIGAIKADEVRVAPNDLPPGRAAEILYACSGMPTMISHISELMLRGMNGYWLSELGATLLAAAEGMASSARAEIDAINSTMAKHGDTAPIMADLAEVTRRLMLMRKTLGRLEKYRGEAEQFLAEEMAESLVALRHTLEHQVSTFAHEQAIAVHTAWRQGQGGRTWRCNAVPLRNILEECVLHTFWEVGKLLVDTERQAAPEIRRMLREAMPDIEPNLRPTSLLNFNMTPSLAPLSKAVVFDLEDKWWQAWWRRSQSAEEKATKIQELVVAEFAPVAHELIHSIESDMEQYVAEAIRRFFARGIDILHNMTERGEKLVGTYEGMLVAAKAAPPLPQEQQRRIAVLRDRVAMADALAAELKACMDHYVPLIHEEKRATS